MSDDRLAVFHRSEEDARSPGAAATLRDWQAHGLPVEVVAFLPAPQDALSRTFGRECVERAFATDTDAAQASAVACGSLLAAARHARDSRVGVACSLADTRRGPFDAFAFVSAWLAARSINVAVLDCCAAVCQVTLLSGAVIDCAPGVAPGDLAPPEVEEDGDIRVVESRPEFATLVDRLHQALDELEQVDVQLLLYRSDAHPSLSAREQATRDWHVWDQTARHGIAVAWNRVCEPDGLLSQRQAAERLCRLITNATRRQYMHHGRQLRSLRVEDRR